MHTKAHLVLAVHFPFPTAVRKAADPGRGVGKKKRSVGLSIAPKSYAYWC